MSVHASGYPRLHDLFLGSIDICYHHGNVLLSNVAFTFEIAGVAKVAA